MRSGAALAVALLVVLSGCAGALGVQTETPRGEATTPVADGTVTPTATVADDPATPTAGVSPARSSAATPSPTLSPTPAAVHPPDPSSDRLGWEGGLWHNETIAVDPADGLNDTERDLAVNRSMARVERVREREFERSVPVAVISRATYRERVRRRAAGVDPNAAIRRNVTYEAAFLLGETESGVDRAADTRANATLGYYSPGDDRIVVVSENATAPRLDEITLAQELFHALQARAFDTRYAAPTRELHNARDGIIEGDGNYVDHRYRERCAAGWDCLRPDRDGAEGDADGNERGGGGGDVHVGIAALRLQPYSDGPAFVRERRREGGWDAVDAVYADPPASTEQTIHPEKYGTDPPTAVELTDASTREWEVPDVPGRADYQSLGEAGLFVTLWYPSVTASREAGEPRTVVVPYREFFAADGEELDRYDYRSNYTAGWDGDLLVPYVRASGNATGYVWKTVWDSPAEAAEFADGYRRLLAYHGARRVNATGSEPVGTAAATGAEGTWRIPAGPFADAFRVVVRGETVLIVNAPTVEALDGIRPVGSGEREGEGDR